MRRAWSFIPTVYLILLLGACAESSTRLTSTWSDPSIQKPVSFEKVIVLFVSGNRDLRIAVEGAIATVLPKAEGVPANLSLPDSDLRNIPKVKKALADIHVDGAIVMRLMGQRERTQWVPGNYPDFWGYYNWACPMFYDPGFTITDTYFQVETKIYNLKTGKMLWAGMSETMNPKDAQQAARELAASIGEDLRKDGFIQ